MRTGFVTVGDTRLHYRTSGEGSPVLFIHAGVADSRMWRDQMDLSGHTSIAFDQRGFGETAWESGPYSNREDALAVLDYLDVESAVVVGCSNGAEAALQLALIAPERVPGLVLVGAAAWGWEPINGWSEEPFWDQIVAASNSGDYNEVVRLEAGLWLAGPARSLEDLDPEVVAVFKEMDLVPQSTERERDAHVQTLEPPTNDQLDLIACPTLVIVGELDLPDLVESASYLAERLSRSSPVILEGTAHLPSLEVPKAFNEVLSQFLTSL